MIVTECTCDSPASHEHRAWCATQHQHPGPDCPGLCEPALTWDDVWAAIGREVWKLAPQDFQDSAHRDLVFGTCWQNVMEAVRNGIEAVAALPDEPGRD